MCSRTLAIGDIHGCDVALERLLGVVHPTADDALVVLGDIVDRGPDLRRCVGMLLDVAQSCRLVVLMGNHEEMMIKSADTGDWLGAWLGFGGTETLWSYGRPPRFTNIPAAHWEFLRDGRDWHETGEAILVHANLEPDVPLAEQTPQWLRWQCLRGTEAPHSSGKRIVCGHTAQHDGLPRAFPGWVCIDTHCYAGQWLTCLDVTTDAVWQANQSGAIRGPIPLGNVAAIAG